MLITKIVEWDMGHRIPNHHSQCRNLHGHRYRMEVVISGEIIETPNDSSSGMLIDFSDLKTILETQIVIPCDHAFMMSDSDDIMINFFKENSALKHFVVPFPPTAEEISKWCATKIAKQIKSVYQGRIKLESVTIWETPTSKACCYAKEI